MITFPQDFTETKYPGYFWNVKEKQLYSIKIDGILKPLKRRDVWQLRTFVPYGWKFDADEWFYQISVKGRKRYLTDNYLNSLELKDSIVPTQIT